MFVIVQMLTIGLCAACAGYAFYDLSIDSPTWWMPATGAVLIFLTWVMNLVFMFMERIKDCKSR